jgi:hypothetical protein
VNSIAPVLYISIDLSRTIKNERFELIATVLISVFAPTNNPDALPITCAVPRQRHYVLAVPAFGVSSSIWFQDQQKKRVRFGSGEMWMWLGIKHICPGMRCVGNAVSSSVCHLIIILSDRARVRLCKDSFSLNMKCAITRS